MKKLLILLLFIPVFCFSQSNRLIKQFDEIKNNKSFLLKTDVYEANYSK